MLTYTISIWHDEVCLINKRNKDATSVLHAFLGVLNEQNLFTSLNKGVVFAAIYNHSDPLNINLSDKPLNSYQIIVRDGNFEFCNKVINPRSQVLAAKYFRNGN